MKRGISRNPRELAIQVPHSVAFRVPQDLGRSELTGRRDSRETHPTQLASNRVAFIGMLVMVSPGSIRQPSAESSRDRHGLSDELRRHFARRGYGTDGPKNSVVEGHGFVGEIMTHVGLYNSCEGSAGANCIEAVVVPVEFSSAVNLEKPCTGISPAEGRENQTLDRPIVAEVAQVERRMGGRRCSWPSSIP